jgi:hypothetical protein
MEDVVIFYGHLVYFAAIWYKCLWTFIWYRYFPRFGSLYQEKSGNTDMYVCVRPLFMLCVGSSKCIIL